LQNNRLAIPITQSYPCNKNYRFPQSAASF
jgi:hypothetical protein